MMDQPQIEIERRDEEGRYVAELPESDRPAELTFRRDADGCVVVDSTFVPEDRRGGGIALQLVQRLVADARAEGTRIVPACPYVRAKAEQRPGWADVMAL